MRPDFLAIGHLAKDLTPDGFTIGGTASYASLTAVEMDMSAAVVTSAGPDIDPRSALAGVEVRVVPSRESTTFANIYEGNERTQFLKAVASAIALSDVPASWRSAPLVLLGPVAGEVSHELAASFPDALVLASTQGWLRQWDVRGFVSPADWEGTDVLPHVDAAMLSIGDVCDQRLIESWENMVDVLIVTRGKEGASVHFGGNWHDVEAFEVTSVDPTGAGDVFAAAYLIRYKETGDPLEAARFASCAASFCVEAQGAAGIPTRAQVERRLRTVP